MKWQKINTVAEIRFARGYTYLDIAGSTADRLCEKYPHLSLNTANPRETTLESDDGLLIYTFGIGSAKARGEIEHKHKKEFPNSLNVFFSMILDRFNVTSANFLGNRSSYYLFFLSNEEAAESFKRFVSSKNIGSQFLEGSKDSKLKDLSLKSFKLRFGNESLNIDINLSVSNRELQIRGPGRQMLQNSLPSAEHFIELDIDIRAVPAIPRELLNVEQFVESNDKLVSTHILPLFER